MAPFSVLLIHRRVRSMWKYGTNLWREGDAGRTQEGDTSTDIVYLVECEVLMKYICAHNLCTECHLIMHSTSITITKA